MKNIVLSVLEQNNEKHFTSQYYHGTFQRLLTIFYTKPISIPSHFLYQAIFAPCPNPTSQSQPIFFTKPFFILSHFYT